MHGDAAGARQRAVRYGPTAPAWLTLVPPSDRWRQVDAAEMLARLGPVLDWGGVTRIGEVTHLDRIGLPVFQAVRPMSRSLAVHQGKGRCEADARISAAMEAIEGACAESVQADGPFCRFDDLPEEVRLPRFLDYGEVRPSRTQWPDAPIRWHAAERFPEGGRVFVPFDTVSVDFTFDGDSPFARSSLGLGAGATLEDATRAALFERIERDAQAYWLKSGMAGQARARVDPQTIEVPWFHALVDHLADLGIAIAVYVVEGVGRLPVVMCRLDDPGYAPSFLGAACRPDPDDALFRAFAEAAQSRLTIISGARDDITPEEPTQAGHRALGAPTGQSTDWRRVRDAYSTRPSLDALCTRLAEDGVRNMLRCDLSPPGVSVVRLWIPGLLGAEQCL
ncbi:YcaO-like family protein [uncultured Sphingosinicella sp.]|uniref:YcaO-like family protein n=1 Tax=uncultured Sphingosinicella sp. TaxID=478748 RepID=UPI0030D94168|tara:strand:+ start:17661 stop:18839 length:1179 start_codon:yes stop_codon:yes gene_type:complete